MNRRLVIVLAIVLLAATALVACSPEGVERDDGLHKAVPSVIGMTLEKAAETLQEAGYEVGVVTPPVAQGDEVVSDQEPVAGTSAPRGSAVDLTVGGLQ